MLVRREFAGSQTVSERNLFPQQSWSTRQSAHQGTRPVAFCIELAPDVTLPRLLYVVGLRPPSGQPAPQARNKYLLLPGGCVVLTALLWLALHPVRPCPPPARLPSNRR